MEGNVGDPQAKSNPNFGSISRRGYRHPLPEKYYQIVDQDRHSQVPKMGAKGKQLTRITPV